MHMLDFFKSTAITIIQFTKLQFSSYYFIHIVKKNYLINYRNHKLALKLIFSIKKVLPSAEAFHYREYRNMEPA